MKYITFIVNFIFKLCDFKESNVVTTMCAVAAPWQPVLISRHWCNCVCFFFHRSAENIITSPQSLHFGTLLNHPGDIRQLLVTGSPRDSEWDIKNETSVLKYYKTRSDRFQFHLADWPLMAIFREKKGFCYFVFQY